MGDVVRLDRAEVRLGTPFVGVAIGVTKPQGAWPRMPSPVWAEGEYPHGFVGEWWAGVMVLAFPDTVAEAMCCLPFEDNALHAIDEDLIREVWDSECGVAQERWDAYRILCVASGFDPGEGVVLLVRGELPAGYGQ